MPIRVDRQPFLLRPDQPPEGAPRRLFDGETETELSPAAQARAREAGVVMRRPQWTPNTMLVHEAALYAEEMGLGGEFHHAAAGAYWETGVDLGSTDVLRGIAEGCGLDGAELAQRLESGYHREQVKERYQHAKDLGVEGTPTYQIAGELMPGDVNYEVLREAVQKAKTG